MPDTVTGKKPKHGKKQQTNQRKAARAKRGKPQQKLERWTIRDYIYNREKMVLKKMILAQKPITKRISLSTHKTVSRTEEKLQALLETNIVTLNDYNRLHKLQDKLKEEYEAELERKEEEREENEKQRLRCMALDNIGLPEDLSEGSKPRHRRGHRETSTNGNGTRKGHKSGKKKKTRSKSAVQRPTVEKVESYISRPVESSPSLQGKTDTGATTNASSAQTQTLCMSNSRYETSSNERSLESLQGTFTLQDLDPSTSQSNTQDPSLELKRSCSSSDRWSKSSRFRHHKHPLAEELEREETIDGLYKIADCIILPKHQKELVVNKPRPKRPKSAKPRVRIMI